jgi:hypothetical protein
MAEQTNETTAASAKVAPPAQNEELVESIVSALAARGVPAGTWLVDVVCVRQALRDADDLLRRLEDAIIRAAAPPAES